MGGEVRFNSKMQDGVVGSQHHQLITENGFYRGTGRQTCLIMQENTDKEKELPSWSGHGEGGNWGLLCIEARDRIKYVGENRLSKEQQKVRARQDKRGKQTGRDKKEAAKFRPSCL